MPAALAAGKLELRPTVAAQTASAANVARAGSVNGLGRMVIGRARRPRYTTINRTTARGDECNKTCTSRNSLAPGESRRRTTGA
jgi:hypothetical protein